MFYKRTLSGKKSDEKEFEFDMFGDNQNMEDDQTVLKVGEPRKVYNFLSADGTLKNGYGFKNIAMPTSETDLDNETDISLRGNEVKNIWKLKWYDAGADQNKYYLFYFNDEGNVCFDNIFGLRVMTGYKKTDFVNTPYACYYRKNLQDAIMLSGEAKIQGDENETGKKLMIITGEHTFTSDTAPKIISCCSHYGKLFAITANARGTLVYKENSDVLEWTDEKTQNLDFSDSRGDLNKIISFNDYLYLFRDFGITRISEYGKDGLFEICHIYQSDSYIHPNTIAETGDNVYFMEGNKLKVFNGSSIKTVDLEVFRLLQGCDNRFAYGECFDGKYYLACRGNFDDDRSIGCENFEGGFKNNILLVLDILSQHIDIIRGVDINKLLALTNKFKSKLVACFYGQHKGQIGELTFDGKVFGEEENAFWESGKTDFGYSGKLKRIKSFLIKSEGDCKVTFISERGEKSFAVKGRKDVQKIRANVLGNQFVVKIETKNNQKVYISNFVLKVSCG